MTYKLTRKTGIRKQWKKKSPTEQQNRKKKWGNRKHRPEIHSWYFKLTWLQWFGYLFVHIQSCSQDNFSKN